MCFIIELYNVSCSADNKPDENPIIPMRRTRMAKDSQLDPKPVRKMKANGGPTMAESALDGESRNNKKQSGDRHKPGNDK